MDRIIIINAEKVGDLSVCLTFNDNTKQTIDVGDFIIYSSAHGIGSDVYSNCSFGRAIFSNYCSFK